MDNPDSTRARADRILGNTPGPTAADIRRRKAAKAAEAGASAAHGLRAAKRKLVHEYQVEAAVQQGVPPFPHTTHAVLTILTVGLWSPIWWGNWMLSKRRRMLNARRAELRRNGIT